MSTIRPSSLPALAQCPRFVSDPKSTDDATAGTARHLAFNLALASADPAKDPPELAALPEEEIEGVRWAIDYVLLHKPDAALILETKGSFMDPSFESITGTPDVVCADHIFDLKWRGSDYSLQMAAYALMQPFDPVTIHLLFGHSQKAWRYQITAAEAAEMLAPVIEAARNPDLPPKPCDFCGWCEARRTCPALLERARAIQEGRPEWKLDLYYPSLIDTPEEMGKALKLAKQIKEWAESVEHHAKEMAIKEGMIPTGFKLTSRAGKRELPDVGATFAQVGLPQAEFLQACEVNFGELSKLFAAFNGLKLAPAKRDLETKLGSLIQRRPASQFLTAE